jgi:transposase
LSYDEIKSIFTHVHYSQKKNCWDSGKRVSIDEISMRKGKGSLVTVVSDIDGGNLIEMIDSHRQDDIIEAL